MADALARNVRRVSCAALCVCGSLFGIAGTAAATPSTVMVTPGSGFARDFFPYLGRPAVSAGGRFVAFDSSRSDIIAGDSNDASDVFVRDTVTGVTERVSVSTGGAQANGESRGPVDVSARGRFVLFASDATNLVRNDQNDFDDVFLRDRKLGTTTIVPHITLQVGGTWVMSANGRFFAAGPPGHDNTIIRYDRRTGQVKQTFVGRDEAGVVDISDNGRAVLVNGSSGPRVWKPLTGRLVRFDQTIGGRFADPFDTYPDAISGNGRFVMFDSLSSNLIRHDTNGTWDVFVRNLVAHHTRRISVGNTTGRQANGSSGGLGLSGDGRYRLFDSSATNLIAGDTNGKIDIFVRDHHLHTTIRCSVSTTGAQGSGRSSGGAIAENTLYVAFLSSSTNLTPADTNGRIDIFERGPGC